MGASSGIHTSSAAVDMSTGSMEMLHRTYVGCLRVGFEAADQEDEARKAVKLIPCSES